MEKFFILTAAFFVALAFQAGAQQGLESDLIKTSAGDLKMVTGTGRSSDISVMING